VWLQERVFPDERVNHFASSDSGYDASSCVQFGRNVENYDILAPGASRSGYLVLLHRFQRDCPAEAAKRGLAGDFLPQCKRLAQENCTMYQKP
jgi:hypothetical protein